MLLHSRTGAWKKEVTFRILKLHRHADKLIIQVKSPSLRFQFSLFLFSLPQSLPTTPRD